VDALAVQLEEQELAAAATVRGLWL
jgi:hypothetical protein